MTADDQSFLFGSILATPVAYRERDAAIVADQSLRLFSPKKTETPDPLDPIIRLPNFDQNWSQPTAAISQGQQNYASPLLAGVRGDTNARLFVPEANRLNNGAVIHVRNGSNGGAATAIGPLAGSAYSSMAAYAPPVSPSGRLYVLAQSLQLGAPYRLYCIQ